MMKSKVLYLIALALIAVSPISAQPTSSVLRHTTSNQATAANSNIAFLGHFGGAMYAVAIRGSFAFVGMGSEFAVIDVSQPASPQRVAYLVLGGTIPAKGIVLANNYAYVVADQLYIIDIHDPIHPTLVEVVAFYDPGGIALSGNYAYVASQGITILDVTDPVNPIQVGYYGDPWGLARTIAVGGRYAHYTRFECSDAICYTAAQIIDIADPAHPTYIATYPLPFYNDYARRIDIAVEGNLAYIAHGNSLYAIDISTPISPTIIGTYTAIAAVSSITIHQGTGYLGDDTGLHTVSVITPSQMTQLGFLDTHGTPATTAINDYGYVTVGDALRIFNFQDLVNLEDMGKYDTIAFVDSLAVQGDWVYANLPPPSLHNGLYIINVSDPGNPFLVSALYTTTLSGRVAAQGTYVYVATDGLAAVDVSDPANPVFLDFQDSSLPSSFSELVISGTYAYLGGALSIMDISDPAALVEVGVLSSANNLLSVAGVANSHEVGFHRPLKPTKYATLGFAISGNYIYRGGLTIINVADVTQPFVASVYSPGNIPWDVAVSENYAYLTDAWVSGLVDIVNISNPMQPVHASYYLAYGIYISILDKYAYLTTDTGAVLVLDLTTPTQPSIAGSYGTSCANNDIVVANGNMYVPCGDRGTYILRLLAPQAFLPLVTQ